MQRPSFAVPSRFENLLANSEQLRRRPTPTNTSTSRDGATGPVRDAGPIRLLIVGPMIGSNAGYVTTQGEALADRLRAAGHAVATSSGSTGAIARLAEICAAIVRGRGHTEVLIVQVYGGRSFVVEDIATRLGRRLGYRIVLHAHGGSLPEFLGRFPRWGARVLGRADAIVVPSSYLARSFAAHPAVPPRIIPNIIDVAAYPHRLRRRAAPRMFWMRSFHPVYNPLMAVRVLARVRAMYADATLVMAGQDKGMIPAVLAEATRLGVSGALTIVGFVDHPGKLREADAADIFINTNRVDNMPVAVIEACALGLPVVSTAVGGVPDLLADGVDGLLVPDDDDAAMASAVARIVDDAALAERLSADGLALAERSHWSRVVTMWHELLTSVGGHAVRGRS